MEGWLRPALILGAMAVLVAPNILEFRAKRRAGREALARWGEPTTAAEWLAHKQHESLQNIAQVLHIPSAVAIALQVAVLTLQSGKDFVSMGWRVSMSGQHGPAGRRSR